MCVYQKRMRNLAAMLIAAALMAASASAETKSAASLAKIQIKNFGRMNDQYFRGAQPEVRDYPALAALGVKTVIDLTRDGRDDERGLVERTGMKFYRIPLKTSERPSAAAVEQFLKLVNEPANWPVFVHCQGGRHRTGAMTAVYRMSNDGWTPDRAYLEMKQFHFEGFPGHPELKKFVYDYYALLSQSRQPKIPTERAVGFPQ